MSKGYLLDTHALLWWMYEAESLSSRAFDAISDGSIDIFVSAVSAMEIATKHRIGKLPHAAPLAAQFVELTAAEGFSPLPITADHGQRAGSYPLSHGDPWDRLLVAQAQIEGLALVTNDAKLNGFGVGTYW